jgi:hypothetical protein
MEWMLIMWMRSFSKVYSGVQKEDVWRIWSDVNNWPKWDKDFEYSKMEGSFSNGNSYVVKPLHSHKMKYTLAQVVENERFLNYCHFLGATIYHSHELEDTMYGLRISDSLSVIGPLNLLWTLLIAKKMASSIPKQMDAVALLAKASS